MPTSIDKIYISWKKKRE